MNTMSLRLGKVELRQIQKLAKTKKVDKSSAVRELIQDGWLFYWIRQYRENKVSLECLAENMEVSLVEAIDLLSKLGIESPVSYEDYISGLKFVV